MVYLDFGLVARPLNPSKGAISVNVWPQVHYAPSLGLVD